MASVVMRVPASLVWPPWPPLCKAGNLRHPPNQTPTAAPPHASTPVPQEPLLGDAFDGTGGICTAGSDSSSPSVQARGPSASNCYNRNQVMLRAVGPATSAGRRRLTGAKWEKTAKCSARPRARSAAWSQVSSPAWTTSTIGSRPKATRRASTPLAASKIGPGMRPGTSRAAVLALI